MRQKSVKYIFIAVIFSFPILSGLIFLHAYGHFFMPFSNFLFKKEKIHIALVAPLDSETGKQIRHAVDLYLKDVSQSVNGRQIEVHYYNDVYEPSNAEETALNIIDESESLVVIGHYSNIESVYAGKLYKKNEMPAIAASASAEAVTYNNRWYFRVIPNARVQAIIIANFLAKNYPGRSISILYEDDAYGQTLKKHFIATTGRRGLVIHNMVDIGDLNGSDTKTAAPLLSRVTPQDIIFIAAHAGEGARALALLKTHIPGLIIFTPDEFATEHFVAELQHYIDPAKTTGDYLNGVYCATPYMSAIANDGGHLFEKEFIRAYGEKPIWEAACYYDALDMAVEAIKKTAILNMAHLKDNRRGVRDALDGFFNSRYALEGLVEDLYFDGNRDVIRPYAIARYFESKLISAPFQYQTLLYENEDTNTLFEDIMTGAAINIDGRIMQNINIIYTWIDEISVKETDFKNDTCTLDFTLSLRTINGFDFDPRELHFSDAMDSIFLGNPVVEEIGPEMTHRKYQIHGRFRLPSDFTHFPFDDRVVAIRLMNKETISNSVIYLPDELKTGSMDTNFVTGARLPDSMDGWRIDSQTCYEDYFTKASHLGLYRLADSNFKINHSRLNVEIRLTRNVHTIVLVFLPLLIIISILYGLMARHPSGKANFTTLVLALLFIGNGVLHGYVLYRFPCNSVMAIEYAILMVYLLLFLFSIVPVIWGKAPWFPRVVTVAKGAYPLAIMAGLVLFYIIYGRS